MCVCVCVCDLETALLSKVGKFADNTKLGDISSCDEDYNKIQEDLSKWNEKRQMSFNLKKKCKVKDIGDNSPHFEYHIRNRELRNINKKSLGAIISNNLIRSDQCNAGSKKA